MIEFEKDLELTIAFNEIAKDDELPEGTLFILDANNKVLSKQNFCHNNKVTLSAKDMSKAKQVVLAKKSKSFDSELLETAYKLNRHQILQLAANNQTIDLSRRRWLTWFPFKICVSGKVRKCWWWPFVRQLQLESLANPLQLANSRLPLIRQAEELELSRDVNSLLYPWFRRCRPVCEGLVEVYERICCLTIRITPTLVDRLRERLKDIIQQIPPIPIPVDPEIPPIPRPDPPPIPFEAQGLFKQGAADELQLNAAADLKALSSLSLVEAENYILARPYLIEIVQTCSQPVLRGAAAIGQGGEFNLCYNAFPFLPRNCRRKVAFRVIQNLDSGPRVIYDGVAAGAWFNTSDDITLTSYDRKALACEPQTPVPGPDGAYVALARIGNTDSVHLDSPDQSSEYAIGALTAISGLAFPEPDLNLAKGTTKNRNWGGVLPLRLDFSKAMAATKAEYYRVSVVESNHLGAPIESTREYLDNAITWYYNDPVFEGGIFTVKKRSMPLTDPTNPSFHKIPYDKLIPADAAWRDNQYHAFVDTREYKNARYLISVEVYDKNFKRVVPNGTGSTGDVNENFSYETWNQPANTTTVPYAALTHMFWWDNRLMTTKIEDLRKNGVESSAECQFMQKPAGDADADFSAGFRAYHEQHGPGAPDFLLNWKLIWKRGLGGAQATLDSGVESTGYGLNPTQSASESFNTMLNQGLPPGESNVKCTFSLMLFAAAKTWNGSGWVHPNALRDTASFALDVSEE